GEESPAPDRPARRERRRAGGLRELRHPRARPGVGRGLTLVKTLAILVATALLVAGCGGGGDKGVAKPIGASNNTSVCAYTNRVGKGRVYVEVAVSPVSLKATACRAFNASFGGRSFGGRAPTLPPGTGRPHCDFNKTGSSYRIELGVFATPHTGT